MTDEQIDERVKFYRTMYGNYAEVAGPAQKDDMLKVSYKSDFVLPEDASAALKRQVEAENTFLWLSDPETIPGCTAALTGAETGKEYTFKAEYPAITAKRLLPAKRWSTRSRSKASSAAPNSATKSSRRKRA